MRTTRGTTALLLVLAGLATTACGSAEREAGDTARATAARPATTGSPTVTTEPPGTEPPGNESPATESPATEPSTTEPPTTEPPTTEPPTTEPSATTGSTVTTGTGDTSGSRTPAEPSTPDETPARPTPAPGDDEALLAVTGTLRLQGEVEGRPGNWHLGRVHIAGQGGSVAVVWIGDFDCPAGEEPVDGFSGGETEPNPCAEVGVTNWQDQEVPPGDQVYAEDLSTVMIDYDGEVSDWSTVPADNLPTSLVFEAVGDLGSSEGAGGPTSTRAVRPTIDLGGLDADLWQLEAMRSVG